MIVGFLICMALAFTAAAVLGVACVIVGARNES